MAKNNVMVVNFEKKVAVDDLVKKYKTFKSKEAKEAYIKGAVSFIDYMNFENVEVICDSILASSCYDTNGNIKINSCRKYLMYVYAIFDQYTNVIVDASKWMEQFNKLYKEGLVDVVCQMMPENLMATLDSVLKMKTDDMMTNYYEPHAFVREQVIKYVPIIHKFVDSMLEGIERINKDVDWKEFINIINNKGDGNG